MREPNGYRETLYQILEANNGQQMVGLKKAAEILGVDPRTLKRKLKFRQIGNHFFIAASVLAIWMVTNND